ncbi:hypothetical protein BDFB_013282 [Asbolus verrucosus]
MEVYC